jgi:hypothetical protein
MTPAFASSSSAMWTPYLKLVNQLLAPLPPGEVRIDLSAAGHPCEGMASGSAMQTCNRKNRVSRLREPGPRPCAPLRK